MAFLSNTKQYTYYLLGFLNSSIVYYWMRKNVHEYGKSGFRLSNQYVEIIPVSKNEILISKISNIVKKAMDNNEATRINKEIDDLLFSYYQFTDDEIMLILNTK